VIIAELVEQGFLKKQSEGGRQIYICTKKNNESLQLNRYINQQTVRYEELEAMQSFAQQSHSCLMKILRNALGDGAEENCQQCGVCRQSQSTLNYDKTARLTVDAWLSKRNVPIVLYKKYKYVKPGLSVLDAKLRSPAFVRFMHTRAKPDILSHLTPELEKMLQASLDELKKRYQFGSVISAPSRTWLARKSVAEFIANALNATLYVDLLHWKTEPKARQGELLNNDQRKVNVEKHMAAQTTQTLPKGAILLLDDYTGSGATLNEAVRSLTPLLQQSHVVIPFTIAAVKWRLGAHGMV